MTLSRFMDIWLGVTGALSIMLVSLDYLFAGAVFGLLSEIGFVQVARRSRMVSMWMLLVWWTGWWAVMVWRNWP